MDKMQRERMRVHDLFARFNSIRTAILIPFSILILCAITIMVFVSLTYTKEAVYENAVNYTGRLLSQLNADIDSYIDYMDNISYMIRSSEDVQDWLFADAEEAREHAQKGIAAQIDTILQSRTDIYNIGIIRADGKALINGSTDMLNENIDVTDAQWYREAMNHPYSFYISSSHVQNVVKDCYKWVVTLSTVVKNRHNAQEQAVVFIDLNYSSISKLCENNRMESQGYVYILDSNRRIVYHPRQQLLYGGLRTEHTDDVLLNGQEYEIVEENGVSRLYISRASEKTGWLIIGVADTGELLRKSDQAQLMYLIVAVLLLIVAVIVSGIIANQITRPVQALRRSMEQVQEGHLEAHRVEVEGNHEIASLAHSFNLMSERIDALVKQNQMEQEDKRRMELRALQSQINPHFLYNTLDSIIWMAEGKKNEEVVVMTAALARLLRQNISNEDEKVSIEREILAAESYLTIQKMRYKDKLEYEINIASDIKHEMILKMVLQPLIENAIYHGLKYKESRGILKITGYRVADDVIIEIRDDGIGMDEETLAHIFEEHKVNYHSNGVGVYNVQKRLQLSYGAGYGLTYESHVGTGTCVTVRIPVIRYGVETSGREGTVF
ncbi:MAG: sensor histidine kinase [Eubacteriales bacterium]|nr:sensor histidine kinase [Eubacteriales bacterium]